ncbi:hypothetical protein WN51_13533 [Melipona quadrifasciata]|uniref:Uncharacterized protein n=1 Tax=Melipona quadrifasciata TaxID=166423 RepID=A0A0M9A1T2_9HYME|nr:hypothetical protein WN51_13533 [Melipona quadrifasciata]
MHATRYFNVIKFSAYPVRFTSPRLDENKYNINHSSQAAVRNHSNNIEDNRTRKIRLRYFEKLPDKISKLSVHDTTLDLNSKEETWNKGC